MYPFEGERSERSTGSNSRVFDLLATHQEGSMIRERSLLTVESTRLLDSIATIGARNRRGLSLCSGAPPTGRTGSVLCSTIVRPSLTTARTVESSNHLFSANGFDGFRGDGMEYSLVSVRPGSDSLYYYTAM